ncbi:MAG: hypothetical protein HYZ14_03615 [Bacteroidetes bacterium]|nr:hypothetical protein [Bacteroidota bacterium]
MISSYISLIILAAMVLFWLGLVFKITVVRYFKIRKQADDAESGRPVQGTIVSAQKSGGRFKMMRLKIEFPNLAQTPIQEEFRFVDSKPEENRYDEGRRVTILIDENAKNGPVVKLAGGKTVIGKGFILLSAILLSTALYGSWFLYKLTIARIQGDWSRIDELFATNEAMPAIGIAFTAALIFQWFLFRFIQTIGSTKKKVSDRELKFYGEKTMATVTRYEDTNVTINDNPKVKFYYTFTDKNGNNHQGEDAIVIGKLEIGLLPTLKAREIFYMPQSPENSKFTENLGTPPLKGCLNGVLILEALIFTGILIGSYVAAL